MRRHSIRGCDHLEGVALVDEVLLSLGRVVHLGRVGADQGVKKRVEAAVNVRLSEYEDDTVAVEQHRQKQRKKKCTHRKRKQSVGITFSMLRNSRQHSTSTFRTCPC